MNQETIFVTPEESGTRLDKVLSERFVNHYSRTYFQTLIDAGLVLLNGRQVKKRAAPKAGDEIEVNFALSPQSEIAPEPIPLEILFEDDDLIVINKSAGMIVHPAPGVWSGTFVNALLHHCRTLSPEPEDVRPGIVHRLDKETSGVLVAAKNLRAQADLVAQFSSRSVSKRYLALCLGHPGIGTVKAPIGRHPVNRKTMAVVETGKEAISEYETLAFNHQLALVQVKILTGRTHQIRVHLSHIGHPILGDSVYGRPALNDKFGVKRQLLHAETLQLTHPVSKEALTFTAPIPDDMERVIQKLTKKRL